MGTVVGDNQHDKRLIFGTLTGAIATFTNTHLASLPTGQDEYGDFGRSQPSPMPHAWPEQVISPVI
jgi:hypothetical protein